VLRGQSAAEEGIDLTRQRIEVRIRCRCRMVWRRLCRYAFVVEFEVDKVATVLRGEVASAGGVSTALLRCRERSGGWRDGG